MRDFGFCFADDEGKPLGIGIQVLILNLGYTFRTRVARRRNGAYFVCFSPVVSKKACKAFSERIRDIRKGSTHKSLEQIALEMNPVMRES